MLNWFLRKIYIKNKTCQFEWNSWKENNKNDFVLIKILSLNTLNQRLISKLINKWRIYNCISEKYFHFLSGKKCVFSEWIESVSWSDITGSRAVENKSSIAAHSTKTVFFKPSLTLH